jgi:hypothetical protein
MTDPMMDLIRSANPHPETMSALPIGRVRERLAEAGLGPGRRLRTLNLRAGVTGAVVAVTVAIVVTVVVATTSEGVGRRDGGVGRPASLGSGQRTLVAHLGVLRRPQTTEDRIATLPTPFHRRPSGLPEPSRRLEAEERRDGGEPLLQRLLLREVTTARGDEITVSPESYRPSLKSSRRTEGLAIAIHTPGNAQASDTGPRPESVPAFLAHGLGVFNDTRRGVMLVPDGVARVELMGFGKVDHQPSVKLDNAAITGMAATVHDNVASFILANLTATSPLQVGTSTFGGGAQIHMIWFNPRGQVIARPTVDVGVLYMTIRGTARRPTIQLGSDALTRGDDSEFAHATGKVSVVRDGGAAGLVMTGTGLPDPHDAAYGVWLVNPNGTDTFLGFYAKRPRNGKVDLEVDLPAGYTRYRDAELTLERTKRPHRPGTVALRGQLP